MTNGQEVPTGVDKGMIDIPGVMEGDSPRFHHTTQNSMQLKTYELFTYGIFYLIFLDCG